MRRPMGAVWDRPHGSANTGGFNVTTTAMDRPQLTKRQRQVLDEIARFHYRHGYCTSVRELMRHFGWTSPNAVMTHLRALRRAGAVQWEPGVARTLRPTGVQR